MSTIEITPELLVDLKAKAEQATPGTWGYNENNEIGYDIITPSCFVVFSGRDSEEGIEYGIEKESNAAYTSAANPQVVLALIAKIENLCSRQTAQGVACCECQEVEAELRQEIEDLRQERQILRDNLKKAVKEND